MPFYLGPKRGAVKPGRRCIGLAACSTIAPINEG